MARILGAPVTDPQGKSARNRSAYVTPSRSSPVTVDAPSARLRLSAGVAATAVLLLVTLALVAPADGVHALSTAETALSGASTIQAQGGSSLASQTLGRGYWHVFIAYAVAWLLVLGWAISIARRLSKVEREIEE